MSQATVIAQSTSPDQLRQAAEQGANCLMQGGVVAIPTDTVYGLACLGQNDQAVAKLREMRSIAPDRALTLHIAEPWDADRYADVVDASVTRAIGKLLPGPVTVRLAVPEQTIDTKMSAFDNGTSLRGTLYQDQLLSIRCVDLDVVRLMLAMIDGPIVAVAAGAGRKPVISPDDLAPSLAQKVDLLIDGGRCTHGKPSTLVDVRPAASPAAAVRIQRQGVYDQRTIDRLLRWSLVLVCSGNTCRSPMAQAIARDLISKRLGVTIDQLDAAGVSIESAGVYAGPGIPATSEAASAMAQRGLSLADHRSQPLTERMIQRADLILTMTQAHRQAIISLMPEAADRVLALGGEEDIADPIGQSQAVYDQTAEQIATHLDRHLAKHLP